MSGYTGTYGEVLFSNGFAYPAANANSTSAQNLMAAASGKNMQPVLPGLFWQQGRINQVVSVEFSVILATTATPTVTFTLGFNSAPFNISGTTLVASNAFATSAWSGGTVHGKALISNFGTGETGGTGTETSLWSTMSVIANNGSTTGGVVAAGGPTNTTTFLGDVNQWLYLTVTFSSGSASNSATLQQVVVRGEN